MLDLFFSSRVNVAVCGPFQSISEVARQWKALPEEEKKTYRDQAQEVKVSSMMIRAYFSMTIVYVSRFQVKTGLIQISGSDNVFSVS